jgi:hypothetical protein
VAEFGLDHFVGAHLLQPLDEAGTVDPFLAEAGVVVGHTSGSFCP